MARVGLVLGAGGSVGLAFHSGVLAALEEVTGWDPRQAEVAVGTSAGSLAASLLRLGLSAPDLRSVSEGRPLSDEGRLVQTAGAPHRPRARARAFLRPRGPASPSAAARGLLAPWTRHPLATAAALIPSGPVGTEAMSAGLDRACAGRWPAGELWVCAVRLDDGRRVVFGRPGSPAVSLGQAVAASCSVPGYYRPVRIGDRRYVDGGVRSIHHAGLLVGTDLDLVVVSAPMAFAGRGDWAGPLRRLVRRQLERELGRLRRQGTPVVVLAPTRRVVAAMGRDPMDARPRRLVSRMARASTLAHLERHPLPALSATGPRPVPAA